MAHDFWIEPSTFHPAVGETVMAGLRVGQDFFGDPVGRDPKAIEKFVVRDAKGEHPVAGIDFQDPAGYVQVDSPGLAVVGYRSRPAFLTLPPEKFDEYLKLEGLERIVTWRAEHGQSKQPSRELFSRCAKSLLSTGAGKGARFDEPLGFRLEIVPESNPYAAKGPMTFRLTFDGKPLQGALVIAMNQNDPQAKASARSDRSGRVTFPIAKPGVWLIKSVHMIAAPAGSNAEWESLWASLTFER